MFEVYDIRTNEVLYKNKDQSNCDSWIFDMNDMKDYMYLFVRESNM